MQLEHVGIGGSGHCFVYATAQYITSTEICTLVIYRNLLALLSSAFRNTLARFDVD